MTRPVITSKALRRLTYFIHDWCPSCGVTEAFHPEACRITPEEWTRLYAYGMPIGIALASDHGRRTIR